MNRERWITIIILIGIVISVLPYSRNIDMTLDGGMYRIGDPIYHEHTSLVIKGVYRNYLFKDNTFSGFIEISNIDETYGSEVFKLRYSKSIAPLIYDKSTKYNIGQFSVGQIINKTDFEEILVIVSEPIIGSSKSWNGDNGLFIVAPSDNRDEAIERAELLSKENGWLSAVEWE